MTDTQIEPALTAEEWAEILDGKQRWSADEMIDNAWRIVGGPNRPARGVPAAIAAANAALPDTDPRKITREMVFCLHEVLANFNAAYLTMGGNNPKIAEQYGPPVEQLAAALESYLPPE